MNAIAARFEQINSATIRRRSKRFKRPSSVPPGAMDATTSSGLSAAHGADAKLPDLLATLAVTAPRRVRSASTTDAKRCIRSRCRNHRVSRFRWFAAEYHCPYAELSRLRPATPPPSEKRFAGEDLHGDGKGPRLPRTTGGFKLIAAAKS